MENLASQYQEHIKILQQRTQNALKNNKLNAPYLSILESHKAFFLMIIIIHLELIHISRLGYLSLKLPIVGY